MFGINGFSNSVHGRMYYFPLICDRSVWSNSLGYRDAICVVWIAGLLHFGKHIDRNVGTGDTQRYGTREQSCLWFFNLEAIHILHRNQYLDTDLVFFIENVWDMKKKYHLLIFCYYSKSRNSRVSFELKCDVRYVTGTYNFKNQNELKF